MSISFLPRADGVAVEIPELRGITPGGHPVFIDREDLLKSSEAQIDISGNEEVNVTVIVNEANDAEMHSRGSDPLAGTKKLSLEVNAANAASLNGAHNVLYLGRYGRDPEDHSRRWTLLGRPPVLRLSSLKSLDSKWDKWVLPLKRRLGELNDLLAASKSLDSLSIALAAETGELSISWPILTLSSLVHRLMVVNALLTVPQVPITEISRIALAESETLPQKLADLIKIGDFAPKPPIEHAPKKVEQRREVNEAEVAFSAPFPGRAQCRVKQPFGAGRLCLLVKGSLKETPVKAWRTDNPAGVQKLIPERQPQNLIQYCFEYVGTAATGVDIHFVGEGLPPGKDNYQLFFETAFDL